jgi:FkbM family methyltransferase
MGYGKSKYPELHYLRTIIKPGFYCLDIGANVGYYSVFLSKYSAASGKIYAVEPVPLFAEIWRKNVKKSGVDNLTLFPFALGESENIMSMGMPLIDGVVHHGMTKIVNDSDNKFERQFEVLMKNPDKLFKDILKLDFVKVDVEGYESIVFANIIETLKKHKPIIQSELSGAENRLTVIRILEQLNYSSYVLTNNELVATDNQIIENCDQDFYFIPNS